MEIFASEQLKDAARKFPAPLYLVGGYVRNSLLGIPSADRDVASQVPAAEAAEVFRALGWEVRAVYPRMGTVKLRCLDTGEELEYTQFRTERYAPGGGHTPEAVTFTEDLEEDARRRDFKMNAIYFDPAREAFRDPLGGIADVRNRLVSAADRPERVFGSDGLRLLRLVRFAAELGFRPEEATLAAARECRDNLDGIAPERIAEEFRKICLADTRYPSLTADQEVPPHLRGVLLLDELGLLERILPEVTAGRGIAQRPDFHRYDVFRHSLEAFRFSPPEIRAAALLHDVGKPVCFRVQGNFYGHDEAGAPIAAEAARRAFGMSKREAAEVRELVRLHMYDMKGETRDNRRKRFLARNSALVPKLMLLIQADYLGCGLREGECPTVTRWKKVLEEMRERGTPLSLRALKVSGADVAENLPDLPKERISEVLSELWDACILDESFNDRERLLARLRERKK